MVRKNQLKVIESFYEFIVETTIFVDLKIEKKVGEVEENKSTLKAFPCGSFYLEIQGMKDYLIKEEFNKKLEKDQKVDLSKRAYTDKKVIYNLFFEWITEEIYKR